jgi:hypothetical protein
MANIPARYGACLPSNILDRFLAKSLKFNFCIAYLFLLSFFKFKLINVNESDWETTNSMSIAV